ncbi:MAG: PH domain-containing protein [Pseudonocardiaceae bacterium]
MAVECAPKPFVVAAAWVGAGCAACWALLTTDPPARVIALAAVGLLGSAALIGTLVRPRLVADTDGLRVGRIGGSRRWPWPAVRRVEVVSTRRFGRRTGMLEIDAVDPDGTEHLVVLTALDLGADPYEVAEELGRISGGRNTRRP